MIALAFSSSVWSQMGWYKLPPSALKDFAPNVNLSKTNPATWVSTNGGKAIKPNGPSWIPKEGETEFVTYQYQYLTYSFGPYKNVQSAIQDLNKLKDLLDKAEFSSYKNDAYVGLYSFRAGEKVRVKNLPHLKKGASYILFDPTIEKELKKDADEIDEKIEALKKEFQSGKKKVEDINQSIEQLIGELEKSPFLKGDGRSFQDIKKDKSWRTPGINPTGGGNSNSNDSNEKPNGNGKKKQTEEGGSPNGNGLKGIIPTSSTFSKWFAVLVDVVMSVIEEVFQIQGLRGYLEKALAWVYQIAPQLVDGLVTALSDFQRKVLGGLDESLDKVADVINDIHEVYKQLKKIQGLVQNADFQEMVNDPSFANIMNGTFDAVKITETILKKQVLKPVCVTRKGKKHCIDIRSIDFTKDPLEIFQGLAKDMGCNLLQNEIRTKQPFVRHLDTKEACNLLVDGNLNAKDWERIGKNTLKNMMCKELGANGKRYESVCEAVVFNPNARKDLKNIGKQILIEEASKELGIGINDAKSIIDSLISGNSEEAFKKGINVAGKKLARKYKMNYDELKTMVAHLKRNKPLDALKNGMNATKGYHHKWFGEYAPELNTLIENKDGKGIKKALNQFFNRTMNEGLLKDVANGGVDVFDKISREGKSMEKAMEEVLKKNGIDVSYLEKILNGDFSDLTKDMRKKIADIIGITNPKARQKFIEGDIKGAFEIDQLGLKDNTSNRKFPISKKQQTNNKIGTMEILVKKLGTQEEIEKLKRDILLYGCLLYTSPSPRDQRGSRMPSSA